MSPKAAPNGRLQSFRTPARPTFPNGKQLAYHACQPNTSLTLDFQGPSNLSKYPFTGFIKD